MKDVGLRIRVQRELRDQFLETCRAQDKPAAQVIREFMRLYVEKHSESNLRSGDEIAPLHDYQGLTKKKFQKSPQ